MKRLLFIAPAAIAVFLVARALVPPSSEETAYVLEVMALALLACGGGVLGGHRFERGDYLRTAWYASAASYALLAFSAPWRWAGPAAPVIVLRGALTFLANAASVCSMWLFARAYRVAGIDLGSTLRKVTTGAIAAALALAIAGVELVQAGRDLLGGRLAAMVDLFGAAGDVIVLALIAPLLLTALALRGGLLMWPWILISAANIAWLLDDAQALVAQLLPAASAHTVESWSEMWRVLACALMLTAGLAQRRLLGGIPSPLPSR
jgi:hypothetical protein